jgi:PAS domain S-box-containing protein
MEKMSEVSSFLQDRFFDLSIDMLCIAHFSGYFLKLNAAWERTLGFTQEELKSQRMFEFVHPDDRERTLEQNRIVRSGGKALGFENRYVRKDGSYRWFRWNAIADMNHQLIYSLARDITESKQAEEERERLLRELQTALGEVRELREILPICMYCKSIRNDQNYWQTVETYISSHTKAQLSHGVCPNCYKYVFKPELDAQKNL